MSRRQWWRMHLPTVPLLLPLLLLLAPGRVASRLLCKQLRWRHSKLQLLPGGSEEDEEPCGVLWGFWGVLGGEGDREAPKPPDRV